MVLDHEKLDVYRVALDFAAWAYPGVPDPEGSGSADARPTTPGFSVHRIVAMLTRMGERRNHVREGSVVHGYVNANGNEGKSGQPEGAGDSQQLAPDPRR